MADPGFPRGCEKILFGQCFLENCMKMKEIGSKGRIETLSPPPPLPIRQCNYNGLMMPNILLCTQTHRSESLSGKVMLPSGNFFTLHPLAEFSTSAEVNTGNWNFFVQKFNFSEFFKIVDLFSWPVGNHLTFYKILTVQNGRDRSEDRSKWTRWDWTIAANRRCTAKFRFLIRSRSVL